MPEAGAPAATTWGAYVAGEGAAAVAFFSGLAAWATLWPSWAGGMRSDGAQILAGWRRTPEADEEAELLWITVLAGAGVRPRDWPEKTVRRIVGWAPGGCGGGAGTLHGVFVFWRQRDWAAA